MYTPELYLLMVLFCLFQRQLIILLILSCRIYLPWFVALLPQKSFTSMFPYFFALLMVPLRVKYFSTSLISVITCLMNSSEINSRIIQALDSKPSNLPLT